MRINIQMDLKEEDYLEDKVKKHLQGIARRMARDVMQKEFEQEIDRIVKLRLDELVNRPKYGDIPQHILKTISDGLQQRINIDTPKIDELVEKKVLNYLEANSWSKDRIGEALRKILQQSVADLIKKRP